MGVLDKLMFWKKETVELDYEVSGCFTLPIDGTEVDAVPDSLGETLSSAADAAIDDVSPEQR